ncbi:hypothetical protein [Blastopirellula retiformator]|uniref:Uncharacterized protein n=1 Tax=Blastopirellula retiformator TaxID=2527970 RepID=A0A5C5V1H1_9BACT|nr:hypothetical protein [Blastopirellula retiformator]TWT31843.1 hypothetical protein Enr8_37680 [Blastopirellula retiformator]
MNFEEEPTATPRDYRPGQFSLWTLLLLSTAIGTLAAAFQLPQQCYEVDQQRKQLEQLESASLSEPWKMINCQRRYPGSVPSDDWLIYLPPDHQFQIACSTLRSDSETGLPTSVAPLTPGEHVVAIRYAIADDQWLVQTRVDDQAILEERLPRSWNPQLGEYSPTRQIAGIKAYPNQPYLLLHNEIFYTPDPGIGGGKSSRNSQTGLRVWIEKREP